MPQLSLLYQAKEASNIFLEYGLLGAILVVLALFAYKMYNRINEDQKEWKELAKQAMLRNDELTKEQHAIMRNNNANQQKLIDIRERDVEGHLKSLNDLDIKLKDLPKEVRKELQVDLLEAKCSPKKNTIQTTPSKT